MPTSSRPCPFCGLLVVVDEADKRIDHEHPVCKGFNDFIEEVSRVVGAPKREIVLRDLTTLKRVPQG